MKPTLPKSSLSYSDRDSVLHGVCDSRRIPTHRNGRLMTAYERIALLRKLFPEFRK